VNNNEAKDVLRICLFLFSAQKEWSCLLPASSIERNIFKQGSIYIFLALAAFTGGLTYLLLLQGKRYSAHPAKYKVFIR